MEQRVVLWDYRKLVAERLRAETGADVTHAAGAGESIRLNDAALDRNMAMVKKVAKAMEKVPSGLDEASSKAAGDADVSGDDAAAAKIAIRAAKSLVGPTLRGTRDLAIAALEKEVGPLSVQEAQAYARRAHWDKPDTWGRIISGRAANPYTQAMTDASLRGAEYETYSTKLFQEAKALKTQANSLIPIAVAEKKDGQLAAALRTKNRMMLLTEQSLDVEKEAKHYEGVSKTAWESIPEWQKAAYAASAFVWSNYAFKDEKPEGV
jgi:hypothetical protein